MREIEFRGKTYKNSELVYGSLIRSDDFYGETREQPKYYICPFNTTFEYDKCYRDSDEVKPETIGQYTGLTDKNGTKIFEGDICLCNRHIADSVDKRTFEIIFDGSWIGLSNKFYGSQISYEEFDLCEVIGNIYDNKELLGENDE